ncbi:HCL144Wp [Eremothecium sinecaudum]|uniref:Aspartokinase n=1 Tax=Eremothecium sinecaudum TaxID=45286 RepID=A0A0X8HRB7_9SACH|nr:HCL144Wp [Eremothecium sinecaudum]AMD20007.1 HCL144Wp [Eremothecium sinecaudum]
MVHLDNMLGLDQKSNWIVQKFGGTSIGKFAENIVRDIIKVNSADKINKVAVVCSARSSYTKSEGTTSRLLEACNLASNNDQSFQNVLQLVRDDHIKNAEIYIQDEELRLQLIEDTNSEMDLVERYLQASQILGEVSKRTMDLIMCVGEKLSCLFITALCKAYDVDAEYVDFSSVIPQDLTEDNDLDNAFYASLAVSFKQTLAPIVRANMEGRHIVPVITGFFGLLPMGLLNSVGRGYTDLCAALVAVALNADELQVWKEVDGIFTADPRKVSEARLLDTVTPEEAAELTYYGSEVIHPFTMEQVIRAKIPIRIKNVQNPTGQGTVIYSDTIARKGEATPPHPPVNIPSSYFEHKRRGATAITAKNDIVVVNIHSNKKTLSHGFLAQIFSTLDKYKLIVDLISTSEVHVSMALPVPDMDSHRNLMEAVQVLKKFGSIEIIKKMAIVSLVGKQMKQFIGIAGAMFTTLAEQKINIEMISQGANEINISCVIDEANSVRALRAIHAKLLEPVDPPSASLNMSAFNDKLQQVKLLDSA